MSDFRLAIRQLQAVPAFVGAVFITLTLAIGGTTGLFSLIDAIILRPLPVHDPGSVVVLQATDDRAQANRPIYYSTFAALQALPVFETLSLYSGGGVFQLEIRGARVEDGIEASTPGLFESLGLTPHVGRFFTNSDAPADGMATAVVVISHDLWQRAFHGDPRAVGETILISGTPAEVIGVTPAHFKGFYIDGGFGFSVPLSFLNRQLGTDPKRPVRGLNAIGRLASGVSLEQARAAVTTAWASLRTDTAPAGISNSERADIAQQQMTMESLATGFSSLRRQYHDPLLIMFAMSAALLLLAAINVSGLLLVRAVARQREVAVRLVLGSPRSRVARQILAEHAVLCGVGTVGGLIFAWWLTRAAGQILWQGTLPLSLELAPTWRVIGFAALVGTVTSLMVSGLPAVAVFRTSFAALQNGRGTTSGRSVATVLLLSAQIALSLMLVVAAGLLGRSLVNLRNSAIGVDPQGLRWSRLFAVPNGYRDLHDAAYYPELVRQISEVPGIRSVALAQHFPTYFPFENLVGVEQVATAGGDATVTVDALMERVTPRFFETVGVPMRQGRDFDWSDDRDHPQVVIINEILRRTLLPAGDPIGRRLRIGNDPSRATVEVVAVVDDAVMGSFKQRQAPVLFRPRMQDALSPRAPVLLFRTTEDPARADRAIAGVIARIGREYPRRFYSLDEQIDRSLLRERLLARLSSFAAALAVLLAAVGIYSAFSLAVARRTREVGVRLAVGASRVSVMGLIVRDSVAIALLGTTVGIAGAWLGAGVLTSWMFGVAPNDVLTFAAAALFMIVTSAGASLRPALRAAAMDPAMLLRAE